MENNETLFYKYLGAKVASERGRIGWTQEKLGKFLGLSRVSIVNIEKGKQKPSVYQLHKISNKFNLSLDTFVPIGTLEVGVVSTEKILGLEIDEKTIIQLNNFLSKIKE
jgi:DNA-binding XRE family transcriptional regulator